MKNYTNTKTKNIITIFFILIIIFFSIKIGNYVIDNKPKNNKGNVILFRR